MSRVRHRLSSETRRPQILRAARLILHQRGYTGLTMRALAKEVGIEEASLYRHFGSKKEILLALIKEMKERTTELLEEVETNETGLRRLLTIQQETLVRSHRTPDVRMAVFLETLKHGDANLRRRTKEAAELYVRTVEQVLREAKQNSEVSCELDPRRTAVLLHCFLLGVLLFWDALDPETPVSERFQAMLRAYFGGVLGQTSLQT